MKRKIVTSLVFLFLLLSCVHSIAQQGVGINTRGVAPDSNAILDVSSTTKGALFPRMTTAQRTAIASPAIGLTVFDLDKRTYWYYAGSEWVEMTTNKDDSTSQGNGNSRLNEDWNTLGNSNAGGEFIGTTNNQPLLFKTNGNERMRVLGNGNVGIGVQSPNELLEAGGSGRAFFGNGAGSSRAGLLIDGVEPNNASRIEAFNYASGGSGRNLIINTSGGGNVGIGIASPTQKLHVNGNAVVVENLGIGQINPQAPLQFASDERNRKIVLWQGPNNDHEFSGFGINNSILRYQVVNQLADHVFYAGTSASTSKELMRIRGNGNVGIDASDPQEHLEVGEDGRAFFGDGQGGSRKGLLIDGIEGTNASRIEAYDYGIPGGRNLVINTNGGGFVGINNPNPHAPLQFANNKASRKIILWESADNNYQYTGFGVDSAILRYNVPSTNTHHVFYAGTSSTTDNELMRIQGNGNVGIDASDPKERLEVGGDGRAFFGDGQGGSRKGLLIDGLQGSNASRIEAYDYGIPGGRNLVINTTGGGNVGIGIDPPTEKLHISGNVKVTGDIKVDGSIVTEAYISPAPDSGFVNFGSTTAPLGYYKDKEGRVYLRGVLTWDDYSLTRIFALPEGYRPAYDQLFLCYGDTGPTIVRVYSTGAVIKGVDVANLLHFTLDQISFRADH